MHYLSLFSGIEAASVAWHSLGWTCVGVAEIEPFPCSVLAHHYPKVPNLGDITKITAADIEALGRIDMIVGGFPCQDLSVAGKRKGLRNADGSVTRSGLFFEAMRLVRCARERCGLRWLLIENVPGLYSSNGGRDFGEMVAEVVGCRFDLPRDGWRNTGVAAGPDGQIEWATLDAQWFGLAQRRKRVFALADFGDWSGRAPLLLEPASLHRHPSPRRTARQDTAGTLSARATAGGGLGTDFECSGGLVAHALRVPSHGATWRGDGCDNLVAHTLRAEGHDASEDGTGRGVPLVPVYAIQGSLVGRGEAAGPAGPGWNADDAMFTLTKSDQHAVVQPYTLAIRGRGGSHNLEYRQDGTANALLTPNGGRAGIGVGAIAFDVAQITSAVNRTRVAPDLPASTLNAACGMHVAHRATVRRLTPMECERLQGFPDGYTAVTHRGKPAADGNRYRALGNSMAVPCMAWIGRRIAAVDAQA